MKAEKPEAILPDAIYKTSQACRLAQMSPKTLYKQIRLRVIKAGGPPFRIRGSELLKLAS